jgi:hypothetical protein
MSDRTMSRFPEAVLTKRMQGIENRLTRRIQELEDRLARIEGKRNAA